MGANAIDVQAFVDMQPIRGLTLRNLVLCSVIMFIDGFDIYIIGQIAPLIAAEMDEPVERLTHVFLFQQVGLSVGAFAISPLADRYGRKSMLSLGAVIFGSVSLASAFVTSITQLALLRGVAGFFLAAIIPNATSLVAEFTPSRFRASFISIAFCGYVLGTMGAALSVIFLADEYGWRSCFVVGGVLPLLFASVAGRLLRESVQFRAKRNPRDIRIGLTLEELDPRFKASSDQHYVLSGRADPAGKLHRLADILSAKYAPVTALLWLSYLTSFTAVGLLVSWSATFFYRYQGVEVASYAAMSLYFLVGGLLGTVTTGMVMDRLGGGKVLVVQSLIAAISIALIGILPFGTPLFALVLFVWGYCQTGSLAGLNSLCAEAYPSEIRSTGIGWAFGLARIGGILGPWLGGLAIASSLDLPHIYALTAIMPLILTVFLFVLAKRVRLPVP